MYIDQRRLVVKYEWVSGTYNASSQICQHHIISANIVYCALRLICTFPLSRCVVGAHITLTLTSSL